MVTVTVSQITDTLKSKLNVGNDAGALEQPDIHYHPDRQKWEARAARRLADNPSLPTTALPDGFPKVLNSPLVWEGRDWKDEKQWVYELNASELKEIGDAVKHFHGIYQMSLFFPSSPSFVQVPESLSGLSLNPLSPSPL